MNLHSEKEENEIAKILWREFDFIAPYLRDDDTIEIMLNPDCKVWIERIGEPMQCIGEMSHYNSQSLFATIAHSMGKIIDNKHPFLEGSLIINGARFAGFYPPISVAPTWPIPSRNATNP